MRNGNTDAFQQIRRVGPVEADFKSPTARRDRKKLLLHRLFENRLQIPDEQIELATQVHVAEYLRLSRTPSSEHDRVRREFIACWPFAPHLLQLLEDQVLVATQAQETRDLIRSPRASVQAPRRQSHRHGGGLSGSTTSTAVSWRCSTRCRTSITPISARRRCATYPPCMRRRQGPTRTRPTCPRSSARCGCARLRWATWAARSRKRSRFDVTHGERIDDNAFQDELSTIVENSFNIHRDGPRLVFREEENPQARLIASARNDRLFEDGSDRDQLAKEVRYVIGGGDHVTQAFRVVILRSGWEAAPWEAVDDADRPEHWDERLPLLVLPVSPRTISAPRWDHVVA